MAVSASAVANLRSPSTPSKAPAPKSNVANVVLGNLHTKPWYPSFYPEELVGRQAEWVYVCPWCFKYTGEIVKFAEHGVCPLRSASPPGEVIYAMGDVEIREVDGEEHKLYCQNLSLFAKLFLETKSVFFDAGTFLYYTLTLKRASLPAGTADVNPHGHVTAFFSKEKLSWDSNTLACILVFPPYQHRGLGQILIAASYHLGRLEKRFGGPEKPLSSLGRRGFIMYWSNEVARGLLSQPKQKPVSIKTLSEQLWILPEDLIEALKAMDVYEGGRLTKSGNVIVNKAKVRAWVEKRGGQVSPSPVDARGFLLDGRRSKPGDGSMLE